MDEQKVETKQTNDKLAKTNQSVPLENNLLKINLKFNTIDEFFDFCEKLSGDKNMSPLDSKEEVAIALLAGASLGLSVPAALNNVVPVNGRATLSNNLQMGLLAKKGIITQIVEDYKPIYRVYYYEYDEQTGEPKKKDNVPVILRTEDMFQSEIQMLIDGYNRLLETGDLTDAEKKMLKPKVKWAPVGMATKVKLERLIQQPDGSWKEAVVERSYSTIDADKIYCVEKSSGKLKPVRQVKDSWKNYESDMLYANAFRRCAKVIGNDLLLNLYSTEEMLDTTNNNYDLTEDGQVKIYDDKGKVKYQSQKTEDQDFQPVTE